MAVWNPRANEIFASALELPPTQRQAYLEQACGADSELRRQAEALLAAHAEAGSFLDRPALDEGGVDTTPPDSGPPLPASDSVVRALGAGLPGVRLRELEGGTDPDVERPEASAKAGPAELPERYRMVGEIARGGMGAVLKGRDTDLGRDIAVKVLLETHRGRTELVQRFVEEAQIAGQLQHPGIVPVYDMGQFGDKRPYFTMKLVKGQTLAKLLKERNGPGDERGRFVGVFEQVCQTLAYAHARGVIHRDLKPANVMVGAFGEVQVMDWGLAKVLTDPERAPGEETAQEPTSVIRTEPGDAEGRGPTQAGSVMGTPAYMAPEQARGEVGRVDERADVFGLGAILCEILTGQPPFVGPSSAVLRQARQGDLADAFSRLDGCGADADLIGLAKHCLAAEPEERPGHAGAVAAAVMAYQHSVAERLRQAEIGRAEAQVKAAEERKRRRLALALTGSVLLTVVLGSGGWVWVAGQRAEQERQQAARDLAEAAKQAQRRQEIAEILGEAAALRGRGDANTAAQARGQVERALALLENAPEETLKARATMLLAELEDEEKDRRLLRRLDEARLAGAELDDHKSRLAQERAVPGYREAFRERGWSVGQDDVTALAKQLARRSPAVRAAVVAALDDWILRGPWVNEPHQEWLTRLVDEVDPSGWASQVRRAAALGRPERRAALENMAKQADVAVLPPAALIMLARRLNDEQSGVSALGLLRRARQEYPGDFWINLILGTVLSKDEGEEGLRYLTAAAALRPDSPGAHNNLGVALMDKGKLDGAMASHQKAIALHPGFAFAHTNLGNALANKGKWDEAIASYQKALALDPKLAAVHYCLGIALQNKGKLDEAVAYYEKALALDPKYAKAHNNLGAVLANKGEWDEAIARFQKALALDPKNAVAHNNLGTALASKGKWDEAVASWQKAIAIDPKNAAAHYNLGNDHKSKGKWDEAIACYQKALALNPKFAAAHTNLGIALLAKGKVGEAIASLQKALDLLPPGHSLRPTVSQLLQQSQSGEQLEKKLPDVLSGKLPANPAQRLEYAVLCTNTQRYSAGARLYAEAFQADAQLADDLKSGHRYNAACAAALASRGEGRDADKLDDKERLRLRRQAVEWLRADLAAWGKHADRAQVLRTMAHWQSDTDLSGLRDKDAVAKLSPEEREMCEKLWADVAALLRQAQGKNGP